MERIIETKSGQRRACGSDKRENVYDGGNTGIIGKIRTKKMSSWGLIKDSRVRVRMDDISSGGVKGRPNKGVVNPRLGRIADISQSGIVLLATETPCVTKSDVGN